jgi:hypothetical protein
MARPRPSDDRVRGVRPVAAGGGVLPVRLRVRPAPLSARTLVHSIAGCAFYGAFATKVLFVHTRGLPRWALPATGALLLTAVVVAWLTSALWLFSVTGLHL